MDRNGDQRGLLWGTGCVPKPRPNVVRGTEMVSVPVSCRETSHLVIGGLVELNCSFIMCRIEKASNNRPTLRTDGRSDEALRRKMDFDIARPEMMLRGWDGMGLKE